MGPYCRHFNYVWGLQVKCKEARCKKQEASHTLAGHRQDTRHRSQVKKQKHKNKKIKGYILFLRVSGCERERLNIKSETIVDKEM